MTLDLMRIEGLEVECIVGLNPAERRREQRIRIDIALSLDLARAGLSGRIADTWDYDEVADAVTNLLRFREYALIETAATELAAMLLGLRADLGGVTVSIEKPGALPGRARAASIRLRRERALLAGEREPRPFGWVERLITTREVSLWLVGVAPEATLSLDEVAQERPVRGWLTRGTLAEQDTRRLVSRPHTPLDGTVGRWTNPGPTEARLFCCSSEPQPPCAEQASASSRP